MFSYVDPSIYRLLEEREKIVTIDEPAEHADNGTRPAADQIHLLGPIPLPTAISGSPREFRWYPFVRRTQHEHVLQIARELRRQPDLRGLSQLLVAQMTVNSMLIYGDLESAQAPLVRVHSCCMTGEIFGSMRCECGPQLDEAFRRIADAGCGAIVYMASHEGRGIGLWAKGITYILQDMGRNTYDANRDLGLPDDSRDFRDAALVLSYFLRRPARIRLMSNNPVKRADLERYGIEIAAIERLVVGTSRHNLRYLHAKREHGHTMGELPPLPEADADEDPRDDRPAE